MVVTILAQALSLNLFGFLTPFHLAISPLRGYGAPYHGVSEPYHVLSEP
jgi:hypothetical protein